MGLSDFSRAVFGTVSMIFLIGMMFGRFSYCK